MLVEHESLSAYLVGSSEMQQADTNRRAGSPRGIRDPPWVRDQFSADTFPRWNIGPASGLTMCQEHACFSEVCASAKGQMLPPRPSIRNGICCSPVGPAVLQAGSSFQAQSLLSAIITPQAFPWDHRLLCIFQSAGPLAAVSTFWLPMVLSVI